MDTMSRVLLAQVPVTVIVLILQLKISLHSYVQDSTCTSQKVVLWIAAALLLGNHSLSKLFFLDYKTIIKFLPLHCRYVTPESVCDPFSPASGEGVCVTCNAALTGGLIIHLTPLNPLSVCPSVRSSVQQSHFWAQRALALRRS